MPTGFTKNVVVIGGGISGLACAFRLRQLGADVTVLEASERPGGVISTIRRNGFLFEGGPQFPRFRRWHCCPRDWLALVRRCDCSARRSDIRRLHKSKSRSPSSDSENLTKIFRVVSGRLWPADGHTREEGGRFSPLSRAPNVSSMMRRTSPAPCGASACKTANKMYAAAARSRRTGLRSGKVAGRDGGRGGRVAFRNFICSYLGPCFGLQAKPGAPSTGRLCEPIDHELWNYSKALPQSNVGHAERIVKVQESLENQSGLYLTGNYLAGGSVGDCVRAAFRAAEAAYIRVQR
jgi:NAD(P)-binding Rossmann-like domain